MASFYKTAVCLVALSGLQSAVAAQNTYKFEAIEVTEADAYLSANLARNGRLAVHISEVAKNDELIASLKTKVEEKGEHTGDTCDATHITADLGTIFHHAFEYKADTPPDYRKLLQEALEKGLTVFNKVYPKTETDWQGIWSQSAGASLTYLLASNSTKIGCVIGKCKVVPSEDPDEDDLKDRALTQATPESETEAAVLFCELSPAVTKEKAPFDEEYFNALISRTAKLAEMTEEDLKAATNDGTAPAAVPTILTAGLIAMLTAVSA